MSDQSKLEEFRRWVLSVLDLAGSSSARQLDYARASKVGVDEIVLQLGDVINVAQARFDDGSMDVKEFRWFELVSRHAWEIESSSDDLWSEEAVTGDSSWQALRDSAVQAKTELSRLWDEGNGAHSA